MDVNRTQGDYSRQLYIFKYHFYKNLVGIKTCQHGDTKNDFYFPIGGLSEPCYNQIMVHLGSYPHHLEYSFKREQFFPVQLKITQFIHISTPKLWLMTQEIVELLM